MSYITKPSTANSDESNMTAESDENGNDYDNINVVVRIRPLTTNEQNKKDSQAIQYPAEGRVMLDDPSIGQSKIFTFNVVFEPEATQEDVFDHCGIKKLIDMALDGFACTVLAYGQTGAGKTYTLTGLQKEITPDQSVIPGIVHMSFAYLFNQIKKRSNLNYVVQVSYLEVYKEHVLDLLNPSMKSLNVRWSKERGFYAENLFVVECEDVGDLEGVLEEGRKNRQVRSHNMNEHSSRSHTILVIMLTSESKDPEDPQNFIRWNGKLSLVDLAGSEKTKKTLSQGETLKEANNINKSLLVLGNCISALADPRKRAGHIPYRDSTLTKLLADSLSGSGMALMIACVSPSRSNLPETLNTLRYAARAKHIKTKPMVRMDPREQLILSLRREVKLLRMENSFLRNQLNIGTGIPHSKPLNSEAFKNIKDEDVKAMVQQYMQENEALRAENAQLHDVRNLLTRDHEQVCRENERLVKRLSELTGSPVESLPASNSSHLSSSLSLRSLADADGKLSASKRNLNRSLTDVNNLSAEGKGLGQRWNSWSSGIPRPKTERHKTPPELENGKTPKLPPLLNKLMPQRSGKRSAMRMSLKDMSDEDSARLTQDLEEVQNALRAEKQPIIKSRQNSLINGHSR